MPYYQGTNSHTQVEYIEDIYTHFIEDLVGCSGHYPCEINLSSVSESDKLTIVLGGDENLKIGRIEIGSNWVRDDQEYTSEIIRLIEHIASDEDYCKEWTERANNRQFIPYP